MNNTAWESLSNQAIGAAGIVYFIALLVLLAEWASLRQVASFTVNDRSMRCTLWNATTASAVRESYRPSLVATRR